MNALHMSLNIEVHVLLQIEPSLINMTKIQSLTFAQQHLFPLKCNLILWVCLNDKMAEKLTVISNILKTQIKI